METIKIIPRDIEVETPMIKKGGKSLKRVSDKRIREDMKRISKFIKDRKQGKRGVKLVRKLTKLMEHDAQMRKSRGFIHESCRNIALLSEPSSEYISVKGKIGKRDLNKISKEIEATHIMIDAGKNNYTKLPYHIYKALCNIRYIVITVTVLVISDGEEESEVFMDREYKIASLNQLLNFLSRRDGLMESIDMYSTSIGWYSAIEIMEDMKILYKKGVAKEATVGDFLYAYGLNYV